MSYTSNEYRPGQPEHNARTYIALLATRDRTLGIHDSRRLLELSDSGGQLFTRADLADAIANSDERHVLSRRDASAAARALWRLVPPVPYEDG